MGWSNIANARRNERRSDCDDCGEPIDQERLDVLDYLGSAENLHVDCKRDREHRGW